MYLAFECISKGDVNRINWQYLIYFAISSAFLLFAYVLIYLFEKIFNLISSVTLVELTNINSDLMIQFSELAPGTFQHSMQVSNLATEAAKRINANSLLSPGDYTVTWPLDPSCPNSCTLSKFHLDSTFGRPGNSTDGKRSKPFANAPLSQPSEADQARSCQTFRQHPTCSTRNRKSRLVPK